MICIVAVTITQIVFEYDFVDQIQNNKNKDRQTFAQKIAGKYIPIHDKYWYFHASPTWWTVVTRLV